VDFANNPHQLCFCWFFFKPTLLTKTIYTQHTHMELLVTCTGEWKRENRPEELIFFKELIQKCYRSGGVHSRNPNVLLGRVVRSHRTADGLKASGNGRRERFIPASVGTAMLRQNALDSSFIGSPGLSLFWYDGDERVL